MTLDSLLARTKQVEVISKNDWEFDGKKGTTYKGEFMGGTIKFSSENQLEIGEVVGLEFEAKLDQGGNVSLKASVIQKELVSPIHTGN
jgi:uncharacterized protein YxjI